MYSANSRRPPAHGLSFFFLERFSSFSKEKEKEMNEKTTWFCFSQHIRLTQINYTAA